MTVLSKLRFGEIPWGLIGGTLAGAAAASLSEQYRAVLNEDPTISLTITGAAIGLLAVTIAVMTLVLGLRTGLYKDIIAAAADPDQPKDDQGIEEFLSPFRQVAVLSAGAAVVSLISLLFGPSQGYPNGTGPRPLEVAIFGIGVWLFVWAVLTTVRLIYIVQRHAINAAKAEFDS